MEIIVQWATILSPLIAVIIAVWSGLSSRKATAKQIESIKELSRLQMDATIKQVELEIEKNIFLAKQAQQEAEGILNINSSQLSNNQEWKNGVTKQWMEKKPGRDYLFYSQYVKELQDIKKDLVANKKKMN